MAGLSLPTPILALSGPTASGKSSLAMALAQATDAEIICADSVQVYRGLDIGSAKPTVADRALVPHHGLDIFDPNEQSDAMAWAIHAAQTIVEIRRRGRAVIICGGSGLYFRALFNGFADIPDIPETIRLAIQARIDAEGPESLHLELSRSDPDAASRIAPRDRQRIGRALEVLEATGVTLTSWQTRETAAPGAIFASETTFITLDPERQRHRVTIEARARAMLAEGFIDEVRSLLDRGLPATAPGLQSLGYRAVTEAITGPNKDRDATAHALAPRLATAHARYAKRQRTWFRGHGGSDLPWHPLDPATLPPLPEALLCHLASIVSATP